MAKEVRANLSASHFDTRAFLSDDALSEGDSSSSSSESSTESDNNEEEKAGRLLRDALARQKQVAKVPLFIKFEAAACIQAHWRRWTVLRRFAKRHEVQLSLTKTASWALWGVSKEALVGSAGAERRLAEVIFRSHSPPLMFCQLVICVCAHAYSNIF